MAFGKKVIVAVGLNDNMAELLGPLREMEFLKHSEIHFIHVFNTMTYAFTFGEVPLIFPLEADKNKIEDSVLKMLAKDVDASLPSGFDGHCVQKCLFSEELKERFVRYVKDQRPDLVIIPTRQKRALFESSFAQFVNRHTEANLILLKHPEKKVESKGF